MTLSRGPQVIHPLVLASFVIVILSLKMTGALEHHGENKNNNNSSSSSNSDFLRQKPLRLEDILPNPDKMYYDKMVPPKEDGKATVVFFHVTVMSLDSIDESSMTFVADIFFGQSWKDGRLRMPGNMTTYRLIPVQFLQDLWRPDSFFKNAKKVTFQDMTIPNHYIWLHEDRSILYMVKLTLLLSCAMNFKTYPHDTQRCAMKIESLSHTVDDLVFVWDPKLPLDVNTNIELPQLDLVSSETGDCTQEYLTGNFTCVEVVFTFKRRLGYYLFHTYVPTCLIVIMSWISFWIKPEAVPARVTLGVTSLLTLSTQHANSQKSLPPVSYIKAIDIFMSTCTIFVFFSLMEYAIVNILMGDFVDSSESLLQRSLRNVRGGVTRAFRPGRRRTPPAEQIPMNGESTVGTPPSEGEHLHGHSSSHQHHHHIQMGHSTRVLLERQEARREKAILIDRLSRVLFPLTFAIFNFAYWSISLSILNAPAEP